MRYHHRDLRRDSEYTTSWDYVLAHGYVREDTCSTPTCRYGFRFRIGRIQVALEKAVAQVTKLEGVD